MNNDLFYDDKNSFIVTNADRNWLDKTHKNSIGLN